MLLLLSMEVVCDKIFAVPLRIANDKCLLILPVIYDHEGLKCDRYL